MQTVVVYVLMGKQHKYALQMNYHITYVTSYVQVLIQQAIMTMEMNNMSILTDGAIRSIEQGSLTGGSVLELAEKEILKTIMKVCKYNQSRAAINLGVSRGCLRAKLAHHFKDAYFTQSEEL